MGREFELQGVVGLGGGLVRCCADGGRSMCEEAAAELMHADVVVAYAKVDGFRPSSFYSPQGETYLGECMPTPPRYAAQRRRFEPYTVSPAQRRSSAGSERGSSDGDTALECRTPAGKEYCIGPLLRCPGAPRKVSSSRRRRASGDSLRRLLTPLDFEACLPKRISVQ